MAEKSVRSAAWAAMFVVLASPLAAEMTATLSAPWDGITVPADQVCAYRGGAAPMTPEVALDGVPMGTTRVVVRYNDYSYPGFDQGGHGILGFAATAGAMVLPSVPAETADLPEGIEQIRMPLAPRPYSRTGAGYLPPCSGGRGHLYGMEITAEDAEGTALEVIRLDMGTY